MKNWLAQEIEVGSKVYRGARDGNSSSFKVGIVSKLNEEKRTARVEWHWGPAMFWLRPDPKDSNTWWRLEFPSKIESVGSPSVDSLALLDYDEEALEAAAHKAKYARLHNLTQREYEDL